MYYRVLGEVAEELKVQVPTVAKQIKETEFLKQKTKQYHGLITSMQASCYEYS